MGKPPAGRKVSQHNPPVHPVAGPRVSAVWALFAISLGGVGLMLWSIDHTAFGAILIGWAISACAALCTLWAYWEEIKNLGNFRNFDRDARTGIVISSIVIAIDIFLPPYLYSIRDVESDVIIEKSIIVINTNDPDNPFFVNLLLKNVGAMPAQGLRRSFKFVPFSGALTGRQEDDWMKYVRQNMPNTDIGGVANEIQHGQEVVSSFPYPMTKAEHDRILEGSERLYMFVYFEYFDSRLSYGKKRIREVCEFYWKKFNLAELCDAHNGEYTTD